MQPQLKQSPQTKQFTVAVGECLTLSDLLLQICGVSLTPYQLEYRKLLVESALSGEAIQLPIQWARQTGKTETHVHTGIALSIYHIRWLNRSYPVAIVTPARQEQSVIVTRERLRFYAERLKPWLTPVLGITFALAQGRRTNDYIFSSNTGFEAPFHCVSASPRAFQKGQTYPLMFLEQIEDMDPYVMETNIFPFGAGSETGAVIVLAGSATPKVTNDYYYKAIQEVMQEKGIQPPWFVDDRLGAQYRPGYGKYAELMRKKLGANNPAYLTQFGNVWVQPINKPFSRDLLLELTWSPTVFTVPKDVLRAVGIDVAKDVDSTVLTGGFRVGADTYIERWLEMQNLDYEDQADKAVDFIQRGKYHLISIDKMGPGNVFADMIAKRLAEKNVDYAMNVQPLTSESNNRIYLQYEQEITNKRLRYSAAECQEKDRFFEQHVDVLRVYGARSMMKLEAPSGQHDDYVASGALFADALLTGVGGPTLLG